MLDDEILQNTVSRLRACDTFDEALLLLSTCGHSASIEVYAKKDTPLYPYLDLFPFEIEIAFRRPTSERNFTIVRTVTGQGETPREALRSALNYVDVAPQRMEHTL